MNDDAEIEQQITDELMDQELARRDVADRSLMDAAAAMRYWPAELGLYEMHACLDDGHLDAARQMIADAKEDAAAEPEREAS
jgi:hypothetical protein